MRKSRSLLSGLCNTSLLRQIKSTVHDSVQGLLLKTPHKPLMMMDNRKTIAITGPTGIGKSLALDSVALELSEVRGSPDFSSKIFLQRLDFGWATPRTSNLQLVPPSSANLADQSLAVIMVDHVEELFRDPITTAKIEQISQLQQFITFGHPFGFDKTLTILCSDHPYIHRLLQNQHPVCQLMFGMVYVPDEHTVFYDHASYPLAGSRLYHSINATDTGRIESKHFAHTLSVGDADEICEHFQLSRKEFNQICFMKGLSLTVFGHWSRDLGSRTAFWFHLEKTAASYWSFVLDNESKAYRLLLSQLVSRLVFKNIGLFLPVVTEGQKQTTEEQRAKNKLIAAGKIDWCTLVPLDKSDMEFFVKSPEEKQLVWKFIHYNHFAGNLEELYPESPSKIIRLWNYFQNQKLPEITSALLHPDHSLTL